MRKKNIIKTRTCIFCKNKYYQTELFRLFFYLEKPLIIYKKKVIDITEEIEIRNSKILFQQKTRSSYFCLECWKNKKDNYKIKQLRYFFSKIKSLPDFLKKILLEESIILQKITRIIFEKLLV